MKENIITNNSWWNSSMSEILESINNIWCTTKTKIEDVISNVEKKDFIQVEAWKNILKKYTMTLWSDLIATSTYRLDNEKKEAHILYFETVNNSLKNNIRETSENLWNIKWLGSELLKELISSLEVQGINTLYIDWIMNTQTDSWYLPVLEFYEKVLSSFIEKWFIVKYDKEISLLRWWKWEDLNIKITIK